MTMAKSKYEQDLLAKIDAVCGKWRVTYHCVQQNHEDYIDNITLATIKVDGNYYLGRANCSNKDTYSKVMGRQVSLGRAWKNYLASRAIDKKFLPESLVMREDKATL